METEEEESQDSKEEPHQIGDNVEMLEIDIPSLNAKHGESHLVHLQFHQLQQLQK